MLSSFCRNAFKNSAMQTKTLKHLSKMGPKEAAATCLKRVVTMVRVRQISLFAFMDSKIGARLPTMLQKKKPYKPYFDFSYDWRVEHDVIHWEVTTQGQVGAHTDYPVIEAALRIPKPRA